MAFNPSTAVCDACVLYPFHQRNVLIQASADGLYDARWTEEIHNEWMRNLIANVPALSIERLHATRRLMDRALPEALVGNFHHHIEAINLPDPDDRHVVAAAIEAKASHILTWNLRDFPAKELRKNRLIRETPDGFLAGIYDEAPDLVIESLANARRETGNFSGVRRRAEEAVWA
jgi:predicted nucleic acid-binding protein